MSAVADGPTRSLAFDGPFALESGDWLPELTVAYRTWGRLSPGGDNAVLVCHALNAAHHVAGYYADAPDNVGWWDNMIGPG